MRPSRVTLLSLAVTSLLLTAATPSPVAEVRAATEPAAPPAPAAPPPTPEIGSYDIGLLLGSQLQHNGLGPVLSIEALVRGLRDGIGGRAPSSEERDGAVSFTRSTREALGERNRTAAHEFLDKNATQPGIVTMPSGLQYRVLADGDPKGTSPRPTDQVTVRYRASLADGTEFDRSEAHDRAATFRVNSVFKGWQEAFLSMKPGAKWQLFVPPELGYGNNSPPAVPPGALLVYELELLRIEAAPAAVLPPATTAPAKSHPPKAAPVTTPK